MFLTSHDFSNSQLVNLKCAIEKGHMKQLPVLYVLNACSGRLITIVYKNVYPQYVTIVIYHLHTKRLSLLKTSFTERLVSVTEGMAFNETLKSRRSHYRKRIIHLS